MRIADLLIEKRTDSFFGFSEEQFYNLLNDWYAGQEPKVRDKFLTIDWGSELKTVPSDIIYRRVTLPYNKIVKLLKTGEPLVLSSKYLTSSWSISKSVANRHFTHRGENLIDVSIKKKLKPQNVVLYTPNLVRIPAIRRLVRGADSTLRDTLTGGGWEKEVIIKNDPYYLTINLNDVILIDRYSIKDFKRWYQLNF